MNTRLLRLRIRRSLIIVPSLYVIAALILGDVTPNIDRRGSFPLRIDVDIDAAQAILTSTATGMLAFTGLVVSSTLLVVQFAATQYSPRLVLWFRRDALVKHAIGSFLAASIYPVVALRELTAGSGITPDISVALSLALLVGASVLFLALLQRVLDRLRPRNLLGRVLADGVAAGEQVYPDALGPDPTPPARDWETADPRIVRVRSHRGVLASFDARTLQRAATAADLTIELVPTVGEFLSPGDELFRVHGTGTFDHRRLLSSLVVSDERTIEQDPAFALRIMVDSAIRALSPAVNDPTTAVQALDTIGDLVRALAGRDLGSSVARGPDGRVRVVWPTPTWDGWLDLAFAEIRAYGASSVQVTRRLRAELLDLRDATDPIRHPALDHQLAMLDAEIARAHPPGTPDHDLASGADRMGLGLQR
ncbi:MAG: DUF2254 domain-containing protein [Solirubrobacteraceae bacterium]|nr:DUF2254 domain-containing protein [Solirubrobacteraceae bacterium]